MKHLLLSVFFFSFVLSLAQAQNHQIIGSVHSADGKSIAGAHILDINSRLAVATNQLGKFQLSVSDSGTVLRISHIGFHPELQNVAPVTTDSKNDISINLAFTLSKESTLLSVVQISPRQNTVLDGKRGVVLRDFSFANGNNLLLMAENGIRFLVLCNDRWEELSRLRVGKMGYKFYEDCLGNTHLFGYDSVYQISIGSNIMELVFATEQSYFLEQVADCSASSKSHLFFSSYQKAGQEIYHYGFHRQTKEGTILQHVFNHRGLQDIQDYFSDLPNQRLFNSRFRRAGSSYANERLEAMQTASCSSNANRPMNIGTSTACIDQLTINRYRNGTRNFWYHRNASDFGGVSSENFGSSQSQYFQSISNRKLEHQQAMMNTWSPSPIDRGWLNMLSQPTYCPLFNLRDSIFVFDHVLGVCYVHDEEGNKVRSFPIEHQEIKGWRNLLVPDANGNRLYVHVKQGNKVYLMEINLNDGTMLRSALLQDAAFVEHLKIKDGYAYYLKEDGDILVPDRIIKVQL